MVATITPFPGSLIRLHPNPNDEIFSFKNEKELFNLLNDFEIELKLDKEYAKEKINEIKENMFNRKFPNKSTCNQALTVWHGECSYIPLVKWNYFIDHVSELIERVERIKEDHENNNSYILHLNVNK